MLKIQKDYFDEFGDISSNDEERLITILNDLNFHNSKVTVEEEIKRIKSIKWKKLSYVIYLVPKATPRPRLGNRGVFYVKGASDNKKIFKEFIKDEDIPLIKTPTKFHCISYMPIPKSMNNVEKVLAELGLIYPISKPDWDNLAKAYCDMIQGMLLLDDSLVVEGSSKKKYSFKPRIEVSIEYMEYFDCVFNEKKIER